MHVLFSQKVTLALVDQVIADTDTDVTKMKEDAENMWDKCSSKRERRTLASQTVPGFTMMGDNVGMFIFSSIHSQIRNTHNRQSDQSPP